MFAFDPHEPVAEWTEVAFLAFGPSSEQLGISDCDECEVLQPEALAVDVDGSIWIADTFKNRIVHFGSGSEGDLLAQTRFRGAEDVRDLEIIRGDVVALLRYGQLVRVNGRGSVVERGDIRDGKGRLYLYDLFQADGRLFAYSFGTDGERGLKGATEIVDIADAVVRKVRGLPVSDSFSAWVDLLGHGGNRSYELSMTAVDGGILDHPFDIVLRRQGVRKEALADVDLLGVVPGRVIVSVKPLFPPWYSPVSVGEWLLSLSPQGDVLGSARSSDATAPSLVLTVGADDHVYRMLSSPDGVLIERLDE